MLHFSQSNLRESPTFICMLETNYFVQHVVLTHLKVKVFTVQNGHTQRCGKTPFCHRERPDVMNQTNGHTLLKSLSSEAFMALLSVLHTKSGEGNGVKHEKWGRTREVQTLPPFCTPSKGGFTHCETIQQALPLKHTEALTLTHRPHLLWWISKVKNKQQLQMKYIIKYIHSFVDFMEKTSDELTLLSRTEVYYWHI